MEEQAKKALAELNPLSITSTELIANVTKLKKDVKDVSTLKKIPYGWRITIYGYRGKGQIMLSELHVYSDK